MKKIMISGLVLAFLLVSASGLQAQKLYIGAQVGYSSQSPTLPDLQTLEFNKVDSFFYGGRLGLKFMMFAVEANYIRSDYTFDQTVTGVIDWDGEELQYQFIGVNAKLFPFSIAMFKPYVTAGYGVYLAEIKNIGDDNKGGYNVGAGIELKISKIALVVEGKYRYGKVNIEGEDLELGNFTLSGGINIYF